MKNIIGLIVSVLGIGIIVFHIYTTAKTQQSDGTFFLVPIGTLMSVGGAFFHIMQNKKKEE